MKTFYFFISK